MHAINGAIDRAILRTAGALGSRWSAVILFLLPLVSLPAAVTSGDPVVIVLWLSSTFLQLVFLPVLLIAGNVQASGTELVIRETHRASMDEFELARTAQQSHAEEIADLKAIAQALHVHLTGTEHPAGPTMQEPT